MHLTATASRATTLLTKNPGLFCRVMLAKLNTARRMPPLPARKRIANVDFEFDLDTYRGTAPMYFGSYAIPHGGNNEAFFAAGRHVFRRGGEYRIFVGYRGWTGRAERGRYIASSRCRSISIASRSLRRRIRNMHFERISAQQARGGKMQDLCDA